MLVFVCVRRKVEESVWLHSSSNKYELLAYWHKLNAYDICTGLDIGWKHENIMSHAYVHFCVWCFDDDDDGLLNMRMLFTHQTHFGASMIHYINGRNVFASACYLFATFDLYYTSDIILEWYHILYALPFFTPLKYWKLFIVASIWASPMWWYAKILLEWENCYKLCTCLRGLASEFGWIGLSWVVQR